MRPFDELGRLALAFASDETHFPNAFRRLWFVLCFFANVSVPID